MYNALCVQNKSGQFLNALSFLQSLCYENYLFQFAILIKKSVINKIQTQNGAAQTLYFKLYWLLQNRFPSDSRCFNQ